MISVFKKILFVILGLAIYRLGIQVAFPIFDIQQIEDSVTLNDSSFLFLINSFTGGALTNFSIFSLGLVPYITASIIVQLLKPYLNKMLVGKKDEKQKLIIKLLTAVISLVQGLILVLNVGAIFGTQESFYNNFFFEHQVLSLVLVSFLLVACSLFLVYLGDQISNFGLGNGISLLIFFNIVSTLPSYMFQAVEQLRNSPNAILWVIMFLAITFGILFIIIFFEKALRKIQLSQAGRNQMAMQNRSRQMMTHLPLKINLGGVIPAIFASALLTQPMFFLTNYAAQSDSIFLQSLVVNFSPSQPMYYFIFFALLFSFTYFYIGIAFNVNEIADNLKKGNSFIPGVRPGRPTADYLSTIIEKLTFIAVFYMSFVVLFPQLLGSVLNIQAIYAGTSLLIVVVVAIDFMYQLSSQLMMNNYDSLIKKNKISI